MSARDKRSWIRAHPFGFGVLCLFVIVSAASAFDSAVTPKTSEETKTYGPQESTTFQEDSVTDVKTIPSEINNDLSNDNYYINVDGDKVHSPAYSDTHPAGATARCRDGTYSFSQNSRGTCSHHGGVELWY